ncbi:MAG: hypothetical protein M3Q45_09620 [Chloroflexota bacterium]|nr:hypothetical protein [Chloroflexota bacterium]
MRTIFTHFETYADADAAVAQLLDEGFSTDELHVIVQAQVAKNNMNVNQATMHVDVTDKLGEQTLHGLAGLLGGRQPVRNNELGTLYAVGELASVISQGTAGIDNAGGGMEATLVEFGIPAETAQAYITGVRNGNLLLGVRTEDERAGAAGNVLRQHNGKQSVSV